MRVGAILPHLLQFGGVRRFLSVGNVLKQRGYEFAIFAKDPKFTRWTEYKGVIKDWKEIQADVLLIGDPPSFPVLSKVRGKVYIWVIAGGNHLPNYKKMERRYPLLLNNRVFRKDFPDPVAARMCEGGIDVRFFRRRAAKVGYQAKGGRTKGIPRIKQELQGLKTVELVPIEGYTDEGLLQVYHTLDYFVCAEERDGWSNMAGEALACGIPVVSTSRNTDPFGGNVIRVSSLRQFFTNPVEEFSWERTVDRLEAIWKEDGVLR